LAGAAARSARWIDIGCGNGAFTELIVQRCAPAEVQGIYSSQGQLAFARNKFDAAVMALVLLFVRQRHQRARAGLRASTQR
jgi:trans-aconitate methyltransferase